MSLEFVVTRLCRDCVDGSCVDVCPVDCIMEPLEDGLPNQLYIDPDQCICCGMCEQECPWDAIAWLDDVPALFHEDIALNRLTVERPEAFQTAARRDAHKTPTPDAVEANKQRWYNLAESLAAGE